MSITPADNAPEGYLDVWLRIPEFDEDGNDNDEAEAEANIRATGNGHFVVDWCLSAVGLVSSSREFASYPDARSWLESEGFHDFSA